MLWGERPFHAGTSIHSAPTTTPFTLLVYTQAIRLALVNITANITCEHHCEHHVQPTTKARHGLDPIRIIPASGEKERSCTQQQCLPLLFQAEHEDIQSGSVKAQHCDHVRCDSQARDSCCLANYLSAKPSASPAASSVWSRGCCARVVQKCT